MVRAPAQILGNASHSLFGHTSRWSEQRSKKMRPFFGGRKNGRSEPGREDKITRCPWSSHFYDRALSRCCCVRLDFAFILIPRDEGRHTRAPSRCLAYVGMKSLRIP